MNKPISRAEMRDQVNELWQKCLDEAWKEKGMTDRELFIKALDSLEWNLPVIQDYGDKEQLNIQHNAITILRDRLEQPERVQLTVRDFVVTVGGIEDVVGTPTYWAEWPNKEKMK